jgi:ribonuclease HII
MARPRASRTLENAARRFGHRHVAGVDEVGRGCLAGPVVAAAVILRPDTYVSRIADSKVVPAPERERLAEAIRRAAVCWHVAIVDVVDIDRLNIHQASLEAMRQAIMALVPLPEFVLVDGFKIPRLLIAHRAVTGGDRRCTAVAAASILAKVARDRLMCELHDRDPRYGFNQHKGYCTAAHLEAVGRYGYSDAHRRSFRPARLFDTMAD